MYNDGFIKVHSVSESCENIGLTLFFQVLMSVDLSVVLSCMVQTKRLDSSGLWLHREVCLGDSYNQMSGRVSSIWTCHRAYMIPSETGSWFAGLHVMQSSISILGEVFLKFSVKIFTLHAYQKSDIFRRHLIWKTTHLLHVLLEKHSCWWGESVLLLRSRGVVMKGRYE